MLEIVCCDSFCLLMFVDVCCYDIMIVTILYHSYHSCPNYGHSHLLLETMVTVSMIIWAEDFFCKWWWLLVLVKILQSPKYTFWRLLTLIKSEGFEWIGRTGLGWFSWFSYLFRALPFGIMLRGKVISSLAKVTCLAAELCWTVEQAFAQWILSLAVLAAFSGGIRHQTW